MTEGTKRKCEKCFEREATQELAMKTNTVAGPKTSNTMYLQVCNNCFKKLCRHEWSEWQHVGTQNTISGDIKEYERECKTCSEVEIRRNDVS